MGTKVNKRRAGKTKYTAKLTTKYQATIPKAVRQYLHLESGDEVVYELLSDGTVIVRKTSPLDLDYLQALGPTLNEWDSAEDDQAYKNL